MLNDLLSYTSKYLRLVWVTPRLAMGFTLVFTMLGWMYVWWLPAVYQSQARLHVDAEAIVNGPLKGPRYYQQDPEQDLVDQTLGRFLTLETLEKVAVDKNLLPVVHAELDKRKVLERLKTDLSFTYQHREGSDHRTQEVSISYRNNDATLSRAVVEGVLDLFLGSILTIERKDGARSRDFLDRQIDRTRVLLSEAEKDLTRFKITHLGYERDRDTSDQSETVLVTPENEEQFRQLNSNYKTIREQHEDFLRRRKSADILSEIEGPSPPLVEVVQPTRTLPDPVEPNRPLLFVLSFFGACALGIATPIFLHFIKRSGS